MWHAKSRFFVFVGSSGGVWASEAGLGLDESKVFHVYPLGTLFAFGRGLER